MGRHRTPKEEMRVWKARVADLLKKEDRCPGCRKLRAFAETATFASPAAEGTGPGLNTMTVCEAHHRIRNQLVFPPKPLRCY